MILKLSQAIAITFFLYLIVEIDKPTPVPTHSSITSQQLSTTSQQPTSLKVLPQPTINVLKPKPQELGPKDQGLEINSRD